MTSIGFENIGMTVPDDESIKKNFSNNKHLFFTVE